MPAVAEVMRDIPEDDEGDAEQSSLQIRMRVQSELGPSSEPAGGKDPQGSQGSCERRGPRFAAAMPICARHVRTSPARPANPFRARELGQVVSMDLSFRTDPSNEKLVILQFVDEASK